MGRPQRSFCLYASQLYHIAKGLRFKLREWEVVFDEPCNGCESKLLDIEAAKLVSNSLRGALLERAIKYSVFRRGDSTLTRRLQAMALLILCQMTRWR
jgi:hypothetical protein